MTLALTWLNCFWLVIPLLLWNIAFAARLTQEQITSDAHSPAWLLGAENLTRLLTFMLPLLLPLHPGSIPGLLVYLPGALLYFASWLPLMFAPRSAWSLSLPGLFAPRLTPLLALIGIAIFAQSWPYALLACVFIGFHTWHGLQNLTPLAPTAA